MSLRDGRLTPAEFEAIALEHGALPGYRYYEDAEVAFEGPDEEALEAVFVRGQRVPSDGLRGDLIWIAVEDDVVLIAGAEFDAMLSEEDSPFFDVYVPEEYLVGTADRLWELEGWRTRSVALSLPFI